VGFLIRVDEDDIQTHEKAVPSKEVVLLAPATMIEFYRIHCHPAKYLTEPNLPQLRKRDMVT
jgi:hypothetical protein